MEQNIVPRPEGLALLPPAWVSQRAALTSTVRIPRAATYSRYSDESQHESSIERQESDSDAYIVRSGWTKVADWADRAQSGAHTVGRDGLLAMLKAAERGEFDRLVIEDVDRLGRDLGILGTVHRTLTDLGIEIHGTRQGRQLDPADVAMRGLQAQETRTLLAFRTQKGRDQAAREGRATRIWYGFRRGDKPGMRVVFPQQRDVVLDIFRMRCDGVSLAGIALVLNQRGIRSSGGQTWSATTIGRLICNPIYKGVLVYKRTRSMQRFNEERRVEARIPAEWIVKEVPAWRVVSDETWEAAQFHGPVTRERRPRSTYLLTSLIRCSECGGTMKATKPINGQANLRCRTNQCGGLCSSKIYYPMVPIEREVLAIVRAQLADPRLEQEYAVAFEEEIQRLERQATMERIGLENRLAELNRLMKASFVEALTNGVPSEMVVGMRQDWHEESEELSARLAALGRTQRRRGMPAPEQLATLREGFDSAFATLPFLPEDEAGHRALAAFRQLVVQVEIQPDGIGRGFRLSVETRLPAVLQGSDPKADGVLTLVVQGRWMSGRSCGVVAARDIERMTRVADSGVLDIDDTIWAIVGPLASELVERRRGKPRLASARPILDGLFFLLRTGFPLYRPPARYGERRLLLSAFERLFAGGGWDAMVAELSARAPEFLEGIDMDAAEMIRRIRSNGNRKP